MTHDLKILPEYFTAVCSGEKTFEVRKDDRPFQVGDTLKLHEINCGVLTQRVVTVEVTYILRHPEYCKEGYCILGIKRKHIRIRDRNRGAGECMNYEEAETETKEDSR